MDDRANLLVPGRNTQAFDIAANLNNATYSNYYYRLKSLALTAYEWKGLPDSCDERFLERTLYSYGRCAFINDETMGFMNLPCTANGNLNVYHIPVSWNVYSIGYSKTYNNDDIVIIRNNYCETPTDWLVRQYAYRLYEIQRTMDVNVMAQKTPVLIYGDEKQMLTLKNLYMKYTGNEPFIFGFKNGIVNAVTVMKTDAPFVADDLQELKTKVWNEACQMLGIQSAPEKRERVQTSEVDVYNDQSDAAIYCGLKPRQEAAEAINKMYGLNVTVDVRQSDKKADEIEQEEGGADYGEIYS